MAFADDLRGLPREEQIARVQAVAREHGDELTDLEACSALGLYETLTPDHDSPGLAARSLHAELAAFFGKFLLDRHQATTSAAPARSCSPGRLCPG